MFCFDIDKSFIKYYFLLKNAWIYQKLYYLYVVKQTNTKNTL